MSDEKEETEKMFNLVIKQSDLLDKIIDTLDNIDRRVKKIEMELA